MKQTIDQTAEGPGAQSDRRFAVWPFVAAALAGLLSAWIASGAVGLLGDPLRRSLTLLALLIAVAAALPQRGKHRHVVLFVALVVSVALISAEVKLAGVFAAAVTLSALAYGHQGQARVTLVVAAEAVVVLGLFRLACLSFPLFWQSANSAGTLLGRASGAVTGQSLWVGASFGGLDYLVASCYIAIAAPRRLGVWSGWGGRGCRLILWGLLLTLAAHLIYLCLLAFAARLLQSLPPPAPPDPEALPWAVADVPIGERLRELVPWNLPALGALIHLLLVGLLLLLSGRLRPAREKSENEPKCRKWLYLIPAGAVLLAVVLPVASVPSWQRADLSGKKIVFYEKGYLNWLKPQHGDYGRLSIGMYGMMPAYLESFGADCVISAELSPEDLDGADAVVLIYPNDPWPSGKLEQIWDYVRLGGSLLVMGEHTVSEEGGGSRFNDVLQPMAMSVRFDSATFAVGGWLQSYEALTHPTTAGIKDTENDFGVVIGATVEARPPARPFLFGRWGWADPGDETAGEAKMGNGSYDAGEMLGDLVLAAEQDFGKGKVVVFGDTSNLSNGLTIGCHEYTSRLFAYLASDQRPLPVWRQIVGIVLVLLLVAVIAAKPRCWLPAAVSIAASVSLAFCTAEVYKRQSLIPDGGRQSQVKLAYIDASHFGAYSRESWRDDGLMGLCLTLMRDGYLTLMLPELTAERLDGARLLVSVAPGREFCEREREAVRRFVSKGGIYICTVGRERVGPAEELLAEFGFSVGHDKPTDATLGKEPRPLGHFKSPYFNAGDYLSFVRFHAAWPVLCDDEEALTVCYYPPESPLIIIKRVGLGLVVLVGDTCFAMNKNLEVESGQPFEGLRENPHFWRWLIAMLEEGEPWYPPKPEVEQPAGFESFPDFEVEPNPQESQP